MDADNTDKKEKFLYEDLTRKIIRALYNVYNRMGYGYREKEFQKAAEEEFKRLGLRFKRELYCRLFYGNSQISRFYLDFLVEDRVVVELKVAEEFYKKHFDQVMTYLKTNHLQLDLLVIFTRHKVLVKRIINQKSA